MPWHIEKVDSEFCVVKDDDGDVEGCHATKVQAERQMSALYASELDSSIKGGDGIGHGASPQAGDQEVVDDVIQKEDKVAVPELDEEKAKAASQMVDERSIIAWLKEKLGLNGKAEPEPEPESADDGTGFTIWKEADEWRWLAVFSNNYRDDDYPPEILSKSAHQDFVSAVDASEWPKPELWFWHVPGTRFGQTDMLAYDEDTGSDSSDMESNTASF